MRYPAAVVAGVIAAAACQEGERLVARPTPWLTVREDLRLDAQLEDFSLIRWIAVSRRHDIAVPLPQDFNIRIYDSTGTRIADVGRRGTGPGEFAHVGGTTWLADTLVVYDARLRRVTYIGRRGELLRVRSLPGPLQPRQFATRAGGVAGNFRFFNPVAAYPGDSLLGYAELIRANGSAVSGEAAAERAMLLISGAARMVATWPLHDARWTMTIDGISRAVPFAFRPQLAVASDGSRFGLLTIDGAQTVNGTYTVSLLQANGDTILRRSYPYSGMQIPRSAIDSAIAAMAPPRDRAEEFPGLSARFQSIARERVPAAYAPVRQLIIGLDDTLWLDLSPTSGRAPITVVLDESGARVASVAMPPSAQIQEASRTHVWATESDADGLVSIVRYRIEGAAWAGR